jgi:hypothetical protein
MRALLLCAAASLTAVVIPVSPAAALNPNTGRTASASTVTIHRGLEGRVRDDDRSRHRRSDVDIVTYGGEWALYNNRSWESDSYNDWWHDRPDRAYPRWMSNNKDCARMWWSGGGWRC